jgi:hypothetical protein
LVFFGFKSGFIKIIRKKYIKKKIKIFL